MVFYYGSPSLLRQLSTKILSVRKLRVYYEAEAALEEAGIFIKVSQPGI